MMLNGKLNEFPTVSLLSGETDDQPKEPNMLTDIGLTDDVEAAIMAAGEAAGAAKVAAKPKRKTLLSEALAAVATGQMPPRLIFPRKSSAQKLADAIFEAMEADNREAVASAQIKGARYDSRMVRAYQAACLAFMDRPLTLPAPLPPAEAPKPKAVKVKAPANSKVAPKAAAKPKPAKKEAA